MVTAGRPPGPPAGRARPRDFVLGAVPVFVVALIVYWATLLPDVGLWDTAEMQAIGPVLGIAHPTGYPSYTLVAWLASVLLQPFGNEAYRADLLSALVMAGASALLSARVVMASRRPLAGLVAGLTFAFTPVAWKWGVRADPHALHVFLAALLLLLLGVWQRRWQADDPRAGRWLVVVAVIYGLALGNHALTLLLAPGIAVYVLLVAPDLLRRRWRLVLGCLAAAAVSAAAVYLYLPLRSMMDPPIDYADPETWAGFRYVVLGEQFRGSFGPLPPLADLVSGAWDEVVRNAGLLAAGAVAGALVGLVRHPRLTLLGLLWFGCTWLFAIGYPNGVIERYYLVPLLMAALWVGLATEALIEAGSRLLAGRGRLAPGLLAVAVAVLAVLLVALPAVDRYRSMDASGEDRGRQFLEAAFRVLEEDAVVVSWWSWSTALWYGQHVEGARPDITVIDDRDILDDGYADVEAAVDAHLGKRPVYLIRQGRDVERLAAIYQLMPVPEIPGEVYRVEGRVEDG